MGKEIVVAGQRQPPVSFCHQHIFGIYFSLYGQWVLVGMTWADGRDQGRNQGRLAGLVDKSLWRVAPERPLSF